MRSSTSDSSSNQSGASSRPVASERVFSVLLLLFSAIPAVGLGFNLDIENRISENRTLAAFPSLGQEPVDAWPKKLEDYYNDHFGFRSLLVRLHNYAYVKEMGISPDPMVVMGREDSYFLAEHVAIFQRGKFSEQELQEWIGLFRKNAAEAARDGAKYYLALVPATPTIYPEYIPEDLKGPDYPSLLDQFIAKAREEGLAVIDVRAELRDARQKAQVHFKTDYHWTDYGAFVAYSKIAQEIKKDFPQLNPLKMSDLRSEPFVLNSTFITLLLGLDGLITEDAARYVVKEPSQVQIEERVPSAFGYFGATQITVNPKVDPEITAALVGDSFTEAPYPYFKESFSRLTYFLTGGSQIDSAVLAREKPQIVIQMLVESKLGWSAKDLADKH